VHKGALGVLNKKLKQDLKIETRFQLASVSKPFTALAFLKLVEEEVFDLEKDIRTYLPDFPYENINPRLLLCHRSGLPNYMYLTDSLWLEAQVNDSLQGYKRSERVGEIAGSNALSHDELYKQVFLLSPSLYYTVNKKFSYCNSNFFLLAYLMEKKLQKPLELILDSLVFRPLGMNESFLYSGMKLDTIPNTAIGYTARYRSYSDFYLNGVLGDKGMFSSVDDMLSAAIGIENGFLKPDTYRWMIKKQTKTNKRGMFYGLGWRVKKYDGNKVIFHKGWWRGFKSYYILMPEEKKTIVVLTNSTMGGFLKADELLGLLD
jgi:CubicO group peptidase (beta-lactamase class C family)